MPTLIRKAIQQVVKASRGSLTSYVINAPHQYGQPLPQSSDDEGPISPFRMRELVSKTPTAAACMNAVLDYALSVPILVRNKDASKKVPESRSRLIQEYIDSPNPRDTGLHYRYQTYRDLFTLGYSGTEIEPDASGKPANLWALDSARLYVDFDMHGTPLGYNMMDSRGFPIKGPDGVHAWNPDEIIYFKRDPISSSLYPTSRITQLFTCAVIEDMMLAFIGARFTDSNMPVGLFDLGEITNEELITAVENWNSQVSSGHRIILTGSKGSNWYNFGYHLKDLEATQLLREVQKRIMSICGVTDNELGDSGDVNKSNGYNLSYTFKKRGVEPLLNEYCATTTKRLLWDELGYKDLELYYEEIDSRDELLQAQIDKEYIDTAVWSVNHVRNRKGLPSVPGGDEPMMFTGSAYLPVDSLRPFAQAQLEAVQAATQAELAGGAGGPIKPPLVRGPQSPEKYTTPDGQGSSTTKIQYGKTQAPRGGKQAMKNAGMRETNE